MPHPDFGRVGWFLGPGGMAEGFPQAVQIQEFWKAGIVPDVIFAESVGVFNGLNPPKASQIWQENFSSPWAVYDLNSDLKRFVEKTLKAYKSIPPPLLRKHKSWLEALRDWSNYRKNYKSSREFLTDLCHLLGHARQILTSLPSLPLGSNPSPKELIPLLEILLSEFKLLGLDKTASLFDPSPLIKKLRETIDFKEALDRSISFHVLARSRNEHHVFSCGTPLSAEAMGKLTRKYKLNEIKSENDLVLASLASSAIGPYFSRVKINGRFFCDSGTINPFPIRCLFDAGCDTIFAFVKNYEIYNHPDEMNILESMAEETDMSMQTIFKYQRDRIMEYAEREGKKKPYIVYPTRLHQDLQTLWISPEAMEYTTTTEKEATRKLIKDDLNLTPADD